MITSINLQMLICCMNQKMARPTWSNMGDCLCTGWRKRLGELQMESDLWWLAWRLEKDLGKTELAFGDDYINQFIDVDLLYEAKNG